MPGEDKEGGWDRQSETIARQRKADRQREAEGGRQRKVGRYG